MQGRFGWSISWKNLNEALELWQWENSCNIMIISVVAVFCLKTTLPLLLVRTGISWKIFTVGKYLSRKLMLCFNCIVSYSIVDSIKQYHHVWLTLSALVEVVDIPSCLSMSTHIWPYPWCVSLFLGLTSVWSSWHYHCCFQGRSQSNYLINVPLFFAFTLIWYYLILAITLVLLYILPYNTSTTPHLHILRIIDFILL